MTERSEIFMRIVVLVVSGIILGVWKYFIFVLALVNWFYVLFAGKRLKELAQMSETWNTQWYVFQRYLIFVTNQRPFPFRSLTKDMSKFGK
ncbi:DUF4389 domain-containing protein [Nanoarchaeota archaeon]